MEPPASDAPPKLLDALMPPIPARMPLTLAPAPITISPAPANPAPLLLRAPMGDVSVGLTPSPEAGASGMALEGSNVALAPPMIHIVVLPPPSLVPTSPVLLLVFSAISIGRDDRSISECSV